ncbi:MAG TPA: hypothetical protein VNV66_08315 [Pilimelia sp.]|nr:hypothetical protein [Pilimelia sp.]
MIEDHPERVGWLDGIPAVDRDNANWHNLMAAERQLGAQRKALQDEYDLIIFLRMHGMAEELIARYGADPRTSPARGDQG